MTAFQITLDGYKNIHNKIRFEDRKDGSYNQIISNINKICDSIDNASVTLRVNFTNKTIEGLHEIVDDIYPHNRKKIVVNLQRVWQTRDSEQDNSKNIDREISLMKEKGILIDYATNMYCSGIRCYADVVNESVVNYDGAIYKCTARDFAKKQGAIGFIGDDGVPVVTVRNTARYLKAPFDNYKCKKCKYTPICLGTCSQKFMESGLNAVNDDCNKIGFVKSLRKELYEDLYKYINDKL